VAYRVTLTVTGSLDLSLLRENSREPMQVETVKEIAQAMETILKDGLCAHMLTFGKNPKTFYFPDEQQRRFERDFVSGHCAESFVTVIHNVFDSPLLFCYLLVHLTNSVLTVTSPMPHSSGSPSLCDSAMGGS
jgi:hypothetical protein